MIQTFGISQRELKKQLKGKKINVHSTSVNEGYDKEHIFNDAPISFKRGGIFVGSKAHFKIMFAPCEVIKKIDEKTFQISNIKEDEKMILTILEKSE